MQPLEVHLAIATPINPWGLTAKALKKWVLRRRSDESDPLLLGPGHFFGGRAVKNSGGGSNLCVK